MRGDDLKNRVRGVLDGESEEEIKSYISDLRSSLTDTNNKLSRNLAVLVALIATHYLSVSNLNSKVKVLGIDFPDEPLFQSIVLLLAAVSFLQVMSLSYLRKFQRECYDWMKVMGYKVMGGTKLHELRLPSDARLAADILRFNSFKLERTTGVVCWIILSYTTFALPVTYIFRYSIKSVIIFIEPFQLEGFIFSIASFLCCLTCCFVMYFHGHLK